MSDECDYSIVIDHVPNYGKVRVLFGLKTNEYKHQDGNIFNVDVEEVKSRVQYKSLKEMLEQKNYI